MRPMGVTVQTGELAIEEILSYARLAEELGYDGFLPTEESGKDAFSVLALAAQATRRIRLGTAIISVYTPRPPSSPWRWRRWTGTAVGGP